MKVKVITLIALTILLTSGFLMVDSEDSSAFTWTYNLYYDANGGTGAPPSESATSSYNNYSFRISFTVPTREGYVFAGWDRTQRQPDEVTSGDYYPGDWIRINAQTSVNDRTLYAVWVTGYTYRLFYSSEADTVNKPATMTYGPTPDLSHTFTVSSTIPSRQGYDFQYWYIGGTHYQSGDTITCNYDDPDKILAASWSAKQFTITFNANGGTVSPTSKVVTYGQTYGELPTPTRTNYRFDGWFIDNNTQITAGDRVTILSDKTAYARWTQTDFIITFDPTGGTVSPTSKVVTYGQTYGELPTPTRQGYSFGGWYIPHWNSHQGGLITADTVVTLDGDKTAYADWIKTDFTITFDPTGGTVSPTSKVVTAGQTYGELPVPVREGYRFAGWYIPNWNSHQGGLITADTVVTLDGDKTAFADWIQSVFTVSFDPSGGTVDPTSKVVTLDETYGELPVPVREGYSFGGWYIPHWNSHQGGLITADTVVALDGDKTAFADWIDSTVYWSNGNPNGSVSILYHIDNTSATNNLTTRYPLYKYNPAIQDVFETEENESFVPTGHNLRIDINSERTGANNYKATATVYLYDDSNNLITFAVMDFGKWNSFIITVDSVNAMVTYTKVMQFRTFTDYQESESGTILSYASYGDYAGQVTQSLTMIGSEVTPRQSVVKTNVFLNTYGVVLRNPSLDIAEYFPEMNKIRLNFYSFALLGNSMTINGHTMNVSAPNITVYYTDIVGRDMHYIADQPGDNVKEKVFELSNIYITWDGERCYLTFAESDFTLDMGTYENKRVSFDGIWYFATGLYEPYLVQEKQYEVNWWGNFDFSTFGIVLAALLIVGGLLAKATIGGRTIDYVIIICGTAIALIIAGGMINA